jgi:hypoxanthine phosphoribosyltransferase
VRTPACGARIALVDDVMTTGATLAEASRTLPSAGAERRMLGRRAHAAALTQPRDHHDHCPFRTRVRRRPCTPRFRPTPAT